MSDARWGGVRGERRAGVAGPKVIALTPVRAKFVRITQTATVDNVTPWSMQQVQLYEIRPSGS